MSTFCLAIIVGFLSLGLWTVSPLHAQVSFFQGKTITIIVGVPPGAVSDRWARLYGRYLGKHAPGNPDIIVRNMPGAGTRVAANYVYSVAKPDGLTLSAIQPGLYLDQLLGLKEVQFNWGNFTWIGSPEQTDEMLYMRSDSPYKNLDDIRKATEPPKCGATGTGNSSYYFPKLLEEILGARFNVVTGYPGATDIDLAVEKGELHCRASTIGAFFGREPGRTWAKTGFVRIFVQGGTRRDHRIPDAPTILELMDKLKSPETTRRVTSVLMATGKFGRPLVGSPGIPPDRVKMLRDAWTKALKEPELVAEVSKSRIDMDPVRGEELQPLAKDIMDQPPEVVAKLKTILGL